MIPQELQKIREIQAGIEQTIEDIRDKRLKGKVDLYPTTREVDMLIYHSP